MLTCMVNWQDEINIKTKTHVPASLADGKGHFCFLPTTTPKPHEFSNFLLSSINNNLKVKENLATMMSRSPMKPHIQKELKNKQKIEKDKETVRPTVINDQLITDYMVDYNRENKIFDDDDRQIWELTHLSLSFKST